MVRMIKAVGISLTSVLKQQTQPVVVRYPEASLAEQVKFVCLSMGFCTERKSIIITKEYKKCRKSVV